jgi:hypothetical protein
VGVEVAAVVVDLLATAEAEVEVSVGAIEGTTAAAIEATGAVTGTTTAPAMIAAEAEAVVVVVVVAVSVLVTVQVVEGPLECLAWRETVLGAPTAVAAVVPVLALALALALVLVKTDPRDPHASILTGVVVVAAAVVAAPAVAVSGREGHRGDRGLVRTCALFWEGSGAIASSTTILNGGFQFQFRNSILCHTYTFLLRRITIVGPCN